MEFQSSQERKSMRRQLTDKEICDMLESDGEDDEETYADSEKAVWKILRSPLHSPPDTPCRKKLRPTPLNTPSSSSQTGTPSRAPVLRGIPARGTPGRIPYLQVFDSPDRLSPIPRRNLISQLDTQDAAFDLSSPAKNQAPPPVRVDDWVVDLQQGGIFAEDTDSVRGSETGGEVQQAAQGVGDGHHQQAGGVAADLFPSHVANVSFLGKNGQRAWD